ncbi:MAG: Phenylalanine--tRNA ligase beta subunit [Methanosaeta sp. PtaB.Bin039]|nr:MAG: Phenylalanine--tRNA ligase beta subunit [Methanosaeta sp. PtaB.Bin039]OPY44380.1 MAG: Phenylalanine--tRNA ligase beta subunit [Methanosaeta sp. PtaU1.Bin028]HOT06244.1 phenylalanine--tRNA ligase subunit beta [Methanotrichaceae archaeon]HQF15446.1 phenylalanine--tRNA ligase subunit beta [Methanotrichaceae archaeon]HQI90181.1 phenylalanine--tRNA ligase subunit beta [Methanotrichaceae archaeon]
MPVVRLYYEDLEQMVGASKETILERLPMMGADIGKRLEEDHVDVEFFPDRPDLYCSEGVARAMTGFLGLNAGLPEYQVSRGPIVMEVDPSVRAVRPVIGCAVIRDLHFSDPAIESLMDLQEDLHWGLGRNRRKVAIGVHDISQVRPPFRYLAADPSFRFVPLDFQDSMSMREVLERHPKGRAFAHILEGCPRYPLILDSDDQVLSFPPIINGELTRVRDETRDLFIDVTGTDPVVFKALNIVVTALAERGGRIEGVTLRSQEGEKVLPDLTPSRWVVDPAEANSLIGFDLGPEELASALQRMRFGARPDGSMVEVLVPAYRADIMHSWDIFEDAAKAFGYENLKAEMPATVTMGQSHPLSTHRSRVRESLAGLGYLEVMPFTLTSEHSQFELMRREPCHYTRVLHPISELHTMVRTDILPGLLEILSMNQHHPLPQRIFAVGDVVVGGRTESHLASASIHSGAGFSEVRSAAEAVLRELCMPARIVPSADGAFIPGRGADIMLEGRRAGCFGELHPAVITGFGLEQPVVGMELET